MRARLLRFTLILVTALAIPSGIRAQGVLVTGRVELVNRASPQKSRESADAVVWLDPNSTTDLHSSRPMPRRRFRVIQQRKRFEPHLLVVPVGSTIEFPNLDPFFHNVFSLFEGKRFDLGLYEAGTTQAVTFDRLGISYIFCNIHPEMSAVIITVNTRYYAVSNRSGDVIIPNVPPGTYRLKVWHERSLPQGVKDLPLQIVASEQEHNVGTIRLTLSADLIARHKNKYSKDYIPPNPPSPFYENP
jgi:plastocyanin